MSESPNAPAPDGAGEADRVELGQPVEPESDGDERDLPRRPDLDQRERNISPARKPMGPPPRRSEALDDAPAAPNAEPPTDPS